MKKFLVSMLAGVLTVGLVAGCGGAKTESNPAAGGSQPAAVAKEIKAIKDRGVLKVGVKVDVPHFGFKDPKTNTIDGFEIDIAKAIAKEILGDPNKVDLQAVNAKTRGPALDNGDIDMVIATFTITDERKKSWNFSDPYFSDAVGLLVKKGTANSLKDLNGKKIGVAQSSTSKAAVQAEADKLGVKVQFLEFATYPEIKAALDAGRVDAFSVDRSILLGYKDDNTVLLADKFSPQTYGVATKLDNKDLAKLVNDVVGKLKSSGDMDKLQKKWELN
jgi:aspartate/glutamate/glutamine transport system substrate-binding protein